MLGLGAAAAAGYVSSSSRTERSKQHMEHACKAARGCAVVASEADAHRRRMQVAEGTA